MSRFICLITLFACSVCFGAQPLPPEKAFKLSVSVVDAQTLDLNLLTHTDYFLYKQKLKVTNNEKQPALIKNINYPPGIDKIDAQDKLMQIYRGKTNIPIYLQSKKPGHFNFQVNYQGCSDGGFCYPPEQKTIQVSFNQNNDLTSAKIVSAANTKNLAPIESQSQEDGLASLLNEKQAITALFLFFGFGLLLSFTPCVLPMIPVLSAIIVGQGKQNTTKSAFLLSVCYVLGMALTYALVGALVALLGANLQLIMQSPFVISAFSLLFVVLALSTMGAFELKLPDAWQARLAGAQKTQRRGHYLGAAVMGSLSTLILSPCVTAPLIGALSYIAQTGNVLFGSMSLFFLGLGMGMPLLLIGTSAGKFVPKAGQWMNLIRTFFGLLLLATAIYLASRVLPAFVTMLLWSVLLIFSGLCAGAFQNSDHLGQRVIQAAGLGLFLYGFLILLGVAVGATDPSRPLAPLANNQPAATGRLYSPNKTVLVSTQNQLNSAIKQAVGKPVIIDFYADWCASCKAMERSVLQTPGVRQALADYVFIKADVSRLGAQQKAMLDAYQVIAPPTFVFLDAQGKEQAKRRLVGEQTKASFIRHLT